LELVHFLGALRIRKDVVKLEISVLDVFGYAIHFELAFMHHHLGVGCAHTVDLTALHIFLLEEWTLPDADAETHLGAA
jgi:hypothetical protein